MDIPISRISYIAKNMANNFSKKYGMEFEDCYSIAWEAVMTALPKFDEERGNIFGYCKVAMIRKLNVERKKHFTKIFKTEPIKYDKYHTETSSPERLVEFSDSINNLNEDAKKLINMALIGDYTKRELKEKINWSNNRYYKAVKEIKIMLAA